VLVRDDEPVAFVAGRIEKRDLRFAFGYRTLYSRPSLFLTILHAGQLGTFDEATARELFVHVRRTLAEGEADVALFNSLPCEHALYAALHTSVPRCCRSKAEGAAAHWRMTCPADLDTFYAGQTSKHRYWLRRIRRVYEKEFGSPLPYRCYQSPDEVDAFCADAEAVAQRTYQRGLGAGFQNTEQLQEHLRTIAEKGWFRAYVLNAGDTPCAFWAGTLYRDVFFLDFTAFDPDMRKHEPGTILFLAMLEELAKSDRPKEIDFGLGDAFYKKRFGDRSWEEASFYLFPFTGRGLLWQFMQATCQACHGGLSWLGKRMGIKDRLKKAWRRRLADSADKKK